MNGEKVIDKKVVMKKSFSVSRMWLVLGLIVCLMCGCGKDDSNQQLSNENEVENTEDIADNSADEIQNVEQEITYETMADLKNAIVSFVEATYTDGSVTCFSDPYDDTTLVNLKDSASSITVKENGYGLIFEPYMTAMKVSSGENLFYMLLNIEYGSVEFLDYLFNSECIFLAEDGTRCSISLVVTKQYEEDDIYYTRFAATWVKEQKNELQSLCDILMKDGVSMRIDQLNSNDEYVTVNLDETTKQNLHDIIEVFLEICEAIY